MKSARLQKNSFRHKLREGTASRIRYRITLRVQNFWDRKGHTIPGVKIRVSNLKNQIRYSVSKEFL